MKIVIIGGVAGGMSAATRLRRLNEDAEIIVLEQGPYVSFANCGLPYYISGEITAKENLLLQTPESLQKRFNLDVMVNTTALKIDPQNKTVLVQDSTKEEYLLNYDSLILSPGAKPFIPPIEGLPNAQNVFTLRNIPDMDAITNFININKPERALVIGAGFIGLEIAESLVMKGLKVTVVEKAPHVLPPLDEEMAAFVSKELIRNKVDVLTGLSATALDGKLVTLENGQQIQADLIILAVGVTPENTLALEAGLDTGIRGGILVNEKYQTSNPDIYAVGDAIVVKNNITHEDALISLASPANRQGRQVADIISSRKRLNKGSLGTAIIRVFGKTVAATGLTEHQLQSLNRKYSCVHLEVNNHAGYFPGAKPLNLKLIFDPTNGEILGAQAVGKEGVDKRIDVLATAIKGHLTVEDLPELELTYAPPFGSAKDPVNMAGYAALNIMEGLSENIQWYELAQYLKEGSFLLDVRTENEFLKGHLKGATHIPLDSLRARLNELPKEKMIIVYCHSGLRSYLAERILLQKNFTVKNLDGAFTLYSTIKPEEVI